MLKEGTSSKQLFSKKHKRKRPGVCSIAQATYPYANFEEFHILSFIYNKDTAEKKVLWKKTWTKLQFGQTLHV